MFPLNYHAAPACYAETDGIDVPQDYAEAGKWFRRAAEWGVARAMYNLGAWYARGEGVPQNYVLAHMWSNLAASLLPPGTDRDLAVINRGKASTLMTPAQIAEAQLLAREWKPKKEGK